MTIFKSALSKFIIVSVFALSSVLNMPAHAQDQNENTAALASIISLLLNDVDSAPPEPGVEFARLLNGQEVLLPFTVEAVIRNPVDTISQVELFVDGNSVRVESLAPYEWNSSNAPDSELSDLGQGEHELTLVATESDGDTFNVSITINIADPDSTPNSSVSLAVARNTAYEKSQESALFTLTRTGSVGPLSVNFELGSGGLNANEQAREQDYDLVYLDTGELVNDTLDFLPNQVERTIQVRPRLDDRFEAPQGLSIRLVNGSGYTVATPNEQSIVILDARNTAQNAQRFVGIFRPHNGADTNASGVLSLVIRGDNQQAILNYSFENLSSTQQDQFLELAPDGNTILDLPRGNTVSNYVWNIAPGGVLTSKQQVIDELFNGNFFVRILSENFNQGEISAFILRSGVLTGEEIPEEELTSEQVDIDIIRFLNQSTFGATEESYQQLRAQIDNDGGNRLAVYEDWIDAQLGMQPTNMTDLMESIATNNELGIATRFERIHTFWTLAVNSPDQLRHRLAQSLSEILVVSDDVNPILNAYLGLTTYWDMLASSGSGTYESLLGEVTRHTSMGTYLSHLQNQKEDPELGIFPDENYAREIMQLFSFGLVHLNQDGSLVLDANNAPIPTYDNDTISEMARVFTGLSVSRVSVRDSDPQTDVENTNFFANDRNSSGNQAQWTHPMKFFPDYHDFGQKTLFTDQGSQVVIAARSGATADADQELDEVISAVVEHSSTAPRISRLLIQQLVTSNPSGAYVRRVAQAFGEDGDMRATIKAILLDQEARNPNVINVESFGKQKSPLFQLTSFMRMTEMSSQFYLDGRQNLGASNDVIFINANLFDTDATFLRVGAFSTTHRNLAAPSVFNFYSPDYSPPGELANRSLVAPEMELLTETSLFDTINEFFLLISNGTLDQGTRADDYSVSRSDQLISINRERLMAVHDNAQGDERTQAAALVDYLDFYYNASQIALTSDVSGTRDFIIDAVASSDGDDKLDLALYGIANAPESLVQK